MRKKLVIFSIILSFGFASFNSKAAVPLLVFLGLTDAAGAVSFAGIGQALAGLGLGAAIGLRTGMIEIGADNDANGVVDSSYRFPLTTQSRDRPVANPELPVTVAPTVTPETTTVPYYGAGANYQNPNAACQASLTATNPNHTYQGVSSSYTFLSFVSSNTTPAPNGYAGICNYQKIMNGTSESTGQVYNNVTTSDSFALYYAGTSTTTPSSTTCGTGYTLQGSDCVITNRNAIPDGKCDIEAFSPAAGVVQYRQIPGDADCASGQGLSISQGAALYSMLHPETGQPVDISVTPPVAESAGGGYSSCPYQVCIPIPNLPGHFRISALSNTGTSGQVVSLDVNAATGVITQATNTPLNGQLLRQGSTYTNAAGQSATVQAGQVVIVQPVGGTYQQVTAAPATTINTSDLAKTGEAAAAAAGVISALNTNLQASDIDVVAPMNSINASLDAITDNLNPKPENEPQIDFAWLPSFLPGTYTACSPFPIDVNPTFGKAAGLVGHGEIDICSKLDFARQFLGWLIGVFTVFFIFRTFVNANKAAL